MQRTKAEGKPFWLTDSGVIDAGGDAEQDHTLVGLGLGACPYLAGP